MPFGSHPNLAPPNRARNGQYDYDVATLAYTAPPRRATAFNDMIERGLKLSPNGWSEARENILQHSRAMVNVHQLEGVNTIAPQRFALCAAYKLPMISENIYDRGIFRHGSMLTSDYANLPEAACQWILRNDARFLDEFGCNLYYLLCEQHTFRKSVEAAI